MGHMKNMKTLFSMELKGTVTKVTTCKSLQLIKAILNYSRRFLSLLRIKIHPTTMITPGQVSFTLLQHMDILKCVN